MSDAITVEFGPPITFCEYALCYVNVGKKAFLSPRKSQDQNFWYGKKQCWHRQ